MKAAPWRGRELWGRLGLGEFTGRVMDGGRAEVPWSVMAQMLVIFRLCEPSSELRLAEHLYARSALVMATVAEVRLTDTEQLGFQIKRGGGLKQIPGAFVGNKGRTIFRRTGKSRLPIEPVQVIGVAQMFNSKTINQRVMAKIEAEFGVELRRAVESVIARR